MTQIDPHCIITRDEASKLTPTLVHFMENFHNFDLWEAINAAEGKVKRGQRVVVAVKDATTVTYAKATVTLVKHDDYRAVDGPIVRVKMGSTSWRVDGCYNFAPIE